MAQFVQNILFNPQINIMKMISKITARFTMLLATLLTSALVFAQDTKKVDVDLSIDKGGDSQWYTQPWVWVVGGAVFILLLVAMLRSGKKD